MKTRLRLVEAQSVGGRDIAILKEQQCKASLAEIAGLKLTTDEASELSEAIPNMGWETGQVDRLLAALVASPFFSQPPPSLPFSRAAPHLTSSARPPPCPLCPLHLSPLPPTPLGGIRSRAPLARRSPLA